MSRRITPLTRNQLLELEALVRNLLSSVTQQLTTPGALSGPNWPLSARSTTASVPFSNSEGGASVSASSEFSSACAGGGLCSSVPARRSAPHGEEGSLWLETSLPGRDDDPSYFTGSGIGDSHHPNEPQHGTATAAPADHPVLHGAFVDVFTDPWTATTWRLYDKIEYIVWWSYRPPSCAQCGMHDAWMPSGDVEFQCASCLNGAGTTRSNVVVEDTSIAKEDYSGMEDSGDEDDGNTDVFSGVGSRVRLVKQSGNHGNSEGGGGPIDAYIFFYEWLQRIPFVRPTGSPPVLPTTGSIEQSKSSADRLNHHTCVSSLPARRCTRASVSVSPADSSSRAEPHGSGATTTAASAEEVGSVGISSSVLLPSGESLSMVLRSAYDMSTLLATPGLPRDAAPIIRAATLYLSLLLHRFVSLFPLFCLAGRASTLSSIGGATAIEKNGRSVTQGPVVAAELHRGDQELQWVDVELISALLGVTSPSFFESTEVSLQHLQNVFTVAAAYRVPSVLWHPGRVPGRVDTVKALKEKLVPLCPVPFSPAGVSGLCPEHTAMIVALELARRVDAHPISYSSTSPAAAAQNAQRIGLWLDALGLYPTRRAYRDVHSYHRCVVAAEAVENGERGSGATDADAAQQQHRIVASWETTLTELAAMKDEGLLAAAERHACRHDGGFDPSQPMVLTTPTSPFHGHFEWILTSPCANALLHVFAAVFRMAPMELADMTLRSGIYQGPTNGFVTTLQKAMLRGAYDIMPLARRLSPLTSSWMCTYMALHSGDRLPLLTALRQLSEGRNTTRDRQAALTRMLQRILRKHHSPHLYQLNYVIRVTDEAEKHFNGVYFLSSILWQEGLATFTCLRSGRKTVTLNRHTNLMSLCYMNAKEKLVGQLGMHVLSPVVAAIETEATQLVMETALGISTASVGDPWGHVVRSLEKCARVRRRMRVPMLASRLDALDSIRERTSTVVRQLHQMNCFITSTSSQLGLMSPTLAGWIDTETLLASAPPLDIQQLRRHLQWNYLCLPHVSLLSGIPEDRVMALYASVVGILELIHLRLSASATAPSTSGVDEALSNWVEELLYVESEGSAAQTRFGAHHEDVGRASGTGWSPQTYRNSRPSTPKLSPSSKSKFGVVSTLTNASLDVTSSAVAALQSGCSSSSSSVTGKKRHINGQPPGISPPLAWQPYTLTPPSVAPLCSPTMRPGAATSSLVVSHSTDSAPTTHYLRTPTLTSVPNTRRSGGEVSPLMAALAQQQQHQPQHSFTTNKKISSGGGCRARDGWAVNAVPLPELELTESTADVAKHKSNALSGARSQHPSQKESLRRRCGRVEGNNDAYCDSDGSSDEEHNDPRKTEDNGHSDAQQERSRGKSLAEADEEWRRYADVMRLLQQALPPYWDVLLGIATDLAGLFRSSPSADNEPDEDDDVDESTAHCERRRRASPYARRSRRPRSAKVIRPTQRGEGGIADAAKGAGVAELSSETLITQKPFSLFDVDECRRRLRRLYLFINVYERQRIVLLQLAAEGKLPVASSLRVAAPPPKPRHQSPLISARPAAAVAGAELSAPVRFSPLIRPKLMSSDLGGNGTQRSPLQRHPMNPPHQGSSSTLSPSFSLLGSSPSTCLSPRPQQQHRSPPEGSGAHLLSGQRGAPTLVPSKIQSKQRTGKVTLGDKCCENMTGGVGDGGGGLTAIADDGVKDALALPPPDVVGPHTPGKPYNSLQGSGPVSAVDSALWGQRVSAGAEGARWDDAIRPKCEHAHRTEDNIKKENSTAGDSAFDEANHSDSDRGASSLMSTEDEQELEATPTRGMRTLKRTREEGGHYVDMSEDRRYAGDIGSRENSDELVSAEQLHRRKAKKTGRRRRRQEQYTHQSVQWKQESSLSPPQRHEPVNDATNNSSDVSTGRGGRPSDEMKAIKTGSPKMPPRPCKVDGDRVKESPASIPTPVPSIRARARPCVHDSACSPSVLSPHSSLPGAE